MPLGDGAVGDCFSSFFIFFWYFSCFNDVHVLFYNFKKLLRSTGEGDIDS